MKVGACGLNFSDIMIRQGRYVLDVRFPYHVGREFSGTVDAVGEGVHTFNKGAAVFGLSFNGGAMSEYVVVDAAAVNSVPPGVIPAEAAALQIQGINALLCVEDYGRVQKGETVVVHSAAGALNYTQGDWVANLKKLTDGRGADVIIDGIGGEVFRRSVFEATAFGGRVVISGVSSGQEEVSLTNFQISAAHRTLVGVSVPSYFPDHVDQLVSAMHRLFELVAQGHLRVRIGHKVPIENAAEAFRLMEERQNVGKVVVTL